MIVRRQSARQIRAALRARASLARANRGIERRFVVAMQTVIGALHARVLDAVEAPAKRAIELATMHVASTDADKPLEGTWTAQTFVKASRAAGDALRSFLRDAPPKIEAAHRAMTEEALAAYDKSMRPILPIGFDKLPSHVQSEAAIARQQSIFYVLQAGRDYTDQVIDIFGDPSETFGLRWEELRDKLLERADVSNSRAELIARDQTLKLSGRINKAKQQSLGIDKYVWSTSLDEAVRESHAVLEGQTFSWDAPPPPGNPGDDYQCRCVAVPVLPTGDEES